jgi:hypothetical protein
MYTEQNHPTQVEAWNKMGGLRVLVVTIAMNSIGLLAAIAVVVLPIWMVWHFLGPKGIIIGVVWIATAIAMGLFIKAVNHKRTPDKPPTN